MTIAAVRRTDPCRQFPGGSLSFSAGFFPPRNSARHKAPFLATPPRLFFKTSSESFKPAPLPSTGRPINKTVPYPAQAGCGTVLFIGRCAGGIAVVNLRRDRRFRRAFRIRGYGWRGRGGGPGGRRREQPLPREPCGPSRAWEASCRCSSRPGDGSSPRRDCST